MLEIQEASHNTNYFRLSIWHTFTTELKNKNEMMQYLRRQALDLAADCLNYLDNKSDSLTVIKTRFAPSQAASLCHRLTFHCPMMNILKCGA